MWKYYQNSRQCSRKGYEAICIFFFKIIDYISVVFFFVIVLYNIVLELCPIEEAVHVYSNCFSLPFLHLCVLPVCIHNMQILHRFKDTGHYTGNCQRPVFSLGVSQHMHKITNLWTFELNWSSNLRDNNERKNTLVTRSCVLSDGWFQDLKF